MEIETILNIAIGAVTSFAIVVGAPFIIDGIQEKLKKKVSLNTCKDKARELCEELRKEFSPTLIWGLRRNGGGMARLISTFFEKDKEIALITTNTKSDVIERITLKGEQKILVVIGKKFDDAEINLLKEINQLKNAEVKICSLVKHKEIEGLDINYTLFDGEKYCKSSFPWDLNTKKRNKRLKWIAGSIIILLLLVLTKVFYPETIKIGIAPFDVENVASLKNLYEDKLASHANEYLSKETPHRPMSPFEFTIDVNQSQDYRQVLEDVRNERTNIAFISSYLCALDSLNYSKDSSIIVIGYMKEGYSDTYKSWLVAKKKNFNRDTLSIENILENIGNGKNTVCLNEIRESGSTHIVPKIFLLENGINPYDEASCNLIYMQKKDMIQFLSKQKNSIGFISSSEYLKQFIRKNTGEWFVHPLDYLIPRDIVIANTTWWKGKTDKEQKQIREALSKGDIKCIPNNIPQNVERDLIRRYHFKNYVGSGVISEIYNKDSVIVFLMPREHDFLKLGKKWNNGEYNNVKIVKYKVFDNEMRMNKVGVGRIKALDPSEYKYKLEIEKYTQNDEDPNIRILKENELKAYLKGAHVLPIDF